MAEQIGLQAVLELADFNKGVEGYLDGLGEMNSQTDSFVGAIGNAIGGVGSFLLDIGEKAALAVAGLGTAAAVGVGAFLTGGIDAAQSLEGSLSQVNSVLGLTGQLTAEQVKQQEELKDLALGLAVDPALKVNAEEAAAAMEMLARQGVEADQILNGMTKSTILLANATKAQYTDAATAAAQSMKIFSDEGKTAEEMINGITAVATNSKITVDQYNLALAQAGAVANAAGVESEDFNTVLAATAFAFSGGSDAGTGYKRFLQTLIPVSARSSDEMKKLGLYTGNTSDESQKAAEDLQKLDAKIAALDPTAKNYQKNLADLTAKKTELTKQLVVGQNAFFDEKGNLKDTADIVDVLHKAFAGLSEAEANEAAQKIFGTDASRTALALAKMTKQEYIDYQNELLKTNAAEIAAEQTHNLAAAMATLGDTFTGIQTEIGFNFLEPLFQGVRALTDLLSENSKAIVEFFQPLVDFLVKQINRIPDVVTAIGPMIGATFDPIRELFFIKIPDALDYFIGTFINGFKQGTDLVDGFFKGIEAILTQPVGMKADFIETPIRLISGAILFLRKAVPQIIDFFGPLITFVTQTLPNAIALVADSFFMGFQKGDSLIHSILQGIGELLKNLFPAETVVPFISALTRLFDFIGGTATRNVNNLGDAVKGGLGVALDFIGTKVLPFLTKAINAFLATGEIPIFSQLAESLKSFDLGGLIDSLFGGIDWAHLIPGVDLSQIFTGLQDLDLSKLSTSFQDVSTSITNFLDNVIGPILEKIPLFTEVFGDAEGNISGFGAVLASVTAGAGGFGLVRILTGLADAAFTLISPLAALATTGAGIATILGSLGLSLSGLILPILAVAAVVGVLALAWINDWGGIREIVANVLGFVMTLAGGVVDFFVTHWPEISTAIEVVGRIFTAFGAAIGKVVTDVLIPLQQDTFAQLTGTLNDLGLTWGDVFSALMTATTIAIGAVILIIGVVIGVVISLATAVASAVNTAVTWWRAFADAALQTFTGAMEIISGFAFALGALLHGDIAGFVQGVKIGFQGIYDFFTGIWSTLYTVVAAPFAIVLSLVGGFIEGIKTFFIGLYDTLVGHSIIPDLMTAIVTNFTSLGPQLLAAVASAVAAVVTGFANAISLVISAVTPLVEAVVAVFTGLVAQIQAVFTASVTFWVTLGAGIISGLIEGFTSMVDSFLTTVGGFVGDILDKLEGLTGWTLPAWLKDMPKALTSVRQAISGTLGFIDDLVRKVKDLGSIELPSWLQLNSPPELAVALKMVADAGSDMPDLAQPFNDLSRVNPDVAGIQALSEALGIVTAQSNEAAISMHAYRASVPTDVGGLPNTQQKVTPTSAPTKQSTRQMDTFLSQLREMGKIDVDAWGVITKQDPQALQQFIKDALAGQPVDKLLESWAGESHPDMKKLYDALQQPFLQGLDPAQIQQTAQSAFNAISDGARSAEPGLKRDVGEVITNITPDAVSVPLEIPVDQATVDTAIVGMQDLMATGLSAADAFAQLPIGLQGALQIAAANGPALNEALVTPFGAASTEVTNLFTQLRAELQTPVTANVQPVDPAVLEQSRQAFSNYVNFVIDNGDYLNDWLTDLPSGIHDSAQSLGQSITEIQTQFSGLGGEELQQAQAAFDNYINAVLTSGDTLNEFLGQLPAATQESALQIGEVVANLNSQLQTTAPTTAITPTVDQEALAATQTSIQGFGATTETTFNQSATAASNFGTSLTGALGPEKSLAIQTGVNNVVGSVDAMNMSVATGQTNLSAWASVLGTAQTSTTGYTTALTGVKPQLDLMSTGFSEVSDKAGEVSSNTDEMVSRIVQGMQRSAESVSVLLAAFDALIAKSHEVDAALPDGVMPGSPPPLAVGLMAVAAAAKGLPDMASTFNAIKPDVGAVNEFAAALNSVQTKPMSVDVAGGSLTPATQHLLNGLTDKTTARINEATSLNTVGASKVATTKNVTVNLAQTNQFDGRVPDDKLVNKMRDETRELILYALEARP